MWTLQDNHSTSVNLFIPSRETHRDPIDYKSDSLRMVDN